MNNAKMTNLQDLMSAYQPGFSLPRDFYTSSDVFDAEVDIFLARYWMLAGHVSRIPEKGDYFLYDLAGHSVIICRTGNGRQDVAAFHNVCRHRGARVCKAAQGRSRGAFTCRYHAWSYKLDGTLANWRHMPEGLDKKDFGLKPCGVRILEGVIFVSLDPNNAPDFEQMVAHARQRWQRYELGNCKIARRQTYELNANWKLGIENNLECYHCLPRHPEYSAAHAFVRADEKVSPKAVDDFERFSKSWEKHMEAKGVPTAFTEFLETDGQLCRAGTWGIKEGFKTGSKDGQPLAPLLGALDDYDGSVTSGCVGALCYIMSYCDYAVLTSYKPQSADKTIIEFVWLVRADAEPDKDFDAAQLSWLWDITTEQDKDVIELNACGIKSRAYAPGPYSNLEWMSNDFIARYIKLMKSGLASAAS